MNIDQAFAITFILLWVIFTLALKFKYRDEVWFLCILLGFGGTLVIPGSIAFILGLVLVALGVI